MSAVAQPTGSDTTAIHPFHVDVPEAELTELRRRISAIKCPERETVTDASQGVQLATMQALARYWATEYDWRKIEAKMNALPQFITEIDGLEIHFIHVRSKHENALPLIVTHGWPGSIIEQMKIIDPLTNPAAHGGSASDAFHVVIPSMPGYGYSGKPTTTGWDVAHIARAWIVLMKRLGYTKFVAQGGDWALLSPSRWACRHLRNCSAFTPTCLAFSQPTLTRQLFPVRRLPRVSQPTRRSLTTGYSLYIKRESPTGFRWGCDRRRYTESRTLPLAWRLTSWITTRAATP